MIRKFLIFVLFANAFSSIPINAEDNVDYDSIINSAVDAIKNEHARSEDVLYALSNSNPEEFMRKVVPIGELVAKEINPKNDSITYKLLMNFKDRIDMILEFFQSQIVSNGYYEHIKRPIRMIKQLTMNILNPALFKNPQDIKLYKNSCEIGDYSYDAVLLYLQYKLVIFCGKPMNSTDAELIAELRAWLKHF
ncbi:hypothetical protein ACQ4LE_006744 [Meloidogyne hapla]